MGTWGHTVCPSVKHIFIMSAAAPKAKKAPAAHPPYAAMITAAIKKLADKKGSPRQAILKYVVANNKVDAAKAAVRVRLALKKMLAAKKLVPAAGKKGAGSFKLPAKAPKAKKPKAKKPKAKKAKKPKAKKPKAAKKPAAKKAKKAAKPAAKKAAKPKAAKKPAAKKPAAKKAKK